jgi:hypothetical protein
MLCSGPIGRGAEGEKGRGGGFFANLVPLQLVAKIPQWRFRGTAEKGGQNEAADLSAVGADVKGTGPPNLALTGISCVVSSLHSIFVIFTFYCWICF